MEALSLLNKVAIITGSSSGIGAASAMLMARRGAKVTLHGRSQAKLVAVQEDMRQAGVPSSNVISVLGDVTEMAVRERLVSDTLDAFGQIDILVNNAGYSDLSMPLLNVGREQLYTTFDLFLHAPLHLAQLCHPHLVKTKGNIVNVSSAISSTISPGAFPYCGSKVLLDLFTRFAATEFGGDGIRVNSVNPGLTRTPLLTRERPGNPDGGKQLLAMGEAFAPLGKNAESEDIAEIVAFYASGAARIVTGDRNICDAGLSLNILFQQPKELKAES